MLADSSDDSGSDLILSVLDIGGISSASESDVEGGDIPAPGEAEPALPSTRNGLSLGRGGRRRMGPMPQQDISTDVEPDRQELLGSMHTCICT